MASGWNLWVWLKCIGVVSGCCCKAVYKFPHNNYYISPTPLVLAFLAAASLLLCSFFYFFSLLFMSFLCMTILESGWNLWVWLVGVVSRRWVWLVGGIYGYGYNV